MASKKIKKLLKKAGKAAAIGAALYGGSKLLGKKVFLNIKILDKKKRIKLEKWAKKNSLKPFVNS